MLIEIDRWLSPGRGGKIWRMTTTTGFTDFAERHRARLLAELTEFLTIPSVSTLPEHAADCRTAAKWVAGHLKELGCPTVKMLGDRGGHPIVWAEGPRVPGRPTVLVYGHYDVQPPDPIDEWHSPPFTPTVVDGRLVARGASDDKGQVYCLLKAFEASRGPDGRPPLNIRFLIEGEEESGSKTLTNLLAKEPERTRADAVLVCDVPYVAPGWPAVYTALRGMCYAEITVRTLASDLHSGLYGGAAPNAHETLVRLLSQLKGPNGRIRIEGLYDDVQRPSRAELAAWKRLPFRERKFLRDEIRAKALTGVQRASVLERLWALPTFEIHGIAGGFTGTGAKTVIPAQATAKVSLRLVPNQKEKKVQRLVASQLKRLAPKWADVRVRFVHGADPIQVDTSPPVFTLVDQAFREVVGRGATPIRSGGSIPIVPALGRSGAPVVLTGIGLPDDGLHAPNEKLTLQQLWDGIAVFARLFELVGSDE
jgi:acetylornithine deacetylase/succinyl-diaminopimelate desuccinylase-like protein